MLVDNKNLDNKCILLSIYSIGKTKKPLCKQMKNKIEMKCFEKQ